MTTNNSPIKVLSRCVHSDYFDNISPMNMEDWIPLIEDHKKNVNIQNAKICYVYIAVNKLKLKTMKIICLYIVILISQLNLKMKK